MINFRYTTHTFIFYYWFRNLQERLHWFISIFVSEVIFFGNICLKDLIIICVFVYLENIAFWDATYFCSQKLSKGQHFQQNGILRPCRNLQALIKGVFKYKVYRSETKTTSAQYIWASSWDYSTYHIGDQRRLRRACASAQSRQSLRCSYTWSMEVDEGSDQK